ncbi:hypothetical protein B0H11DRAFT_1943837 [Mycena galericulata]|nr:hypothetical protein B0H11DRAFT_1943837 [Mycena galericulata]
MPKSKFPYDTPPDATRMSADEIRAHNARVASWVYNAENRQVRNEKTRMRMAKWVTCTLAQKGRSSRLRAAEAERPAEEREARRQARLAASRKYRASNRDVLARRERKRRRNERKKPDYPEKLRLLREKRREKNGATGEVTPPSSGPSDSPTMLTSPPPGFIPCEIPSYLGSNWRDHVEFSGWGNRTYWLLLLGAKQGVYSLKVTCIAAIEDGYEASQVIEGFQRWEQVLPAWAKHCYHRHRKCAQHTEACAEGPCPEHPRQAPAAKLDVIRPKRERSVRGSSTPAATQERGGKVKRDPDAGAGIKSGSPAPKIKKAESPAPASITRAKPVRAQRAPPPTYTPTPVPETDSESEMPAGSVPLYDPDSSDDDIRTVPLSPTPGARGYAPREPQRVRQLEEIKRDYMPRQKRSQASLTSPAKSTEPAVPAVPAVSTVPSTSRGGGAREGKQREWTLGESASAGPSRMTPASLSWDDPFYVAGGTIHHSSKKAFEDVGSGPVRVVMGWEAATRAARDAVQGGGSAMDL